MKYTMKQLTLIYTLVMIQGLLGARIPTSQSSQCNGDDLMKAAYDIFDALGINLPLLISTQQSYKVCMDWLSQHLKTTSSHIKAKQSEDKDNVCYQSLLDRLSHMPANYEDELKAYNYDKAQGELYNRLNESLVLVVDCFREKHASYSSCPDIVKCSEPGETILYNDDKFTSKDIEDFLRDYKRGLEETCTSIGTVEFDIYNRFRNKCIET